MRLVSLQLTRYGNFAADRIDFDPLPGRVNLLFAPNGGGKSVVRQAFCDLLFGISGQPLRRCQDPAPTLAGAHPKHSEQAGSGGR